MGRITKAASIICFLLFFSLSCASAPYEKQLIPEPNFPESFNSPEIKIDPKEFLKQIKIPDMPNFIFVNIDQTGKIIQVPDNQIDDAKYILMTDDGYKKLDALLSIILKYEELMIANGELTNIKIEKINLLIDALKFERYKADTYKSLWQNTEETLRKEQKYNKLRESIDNGVFRVLSVGAIIALIMSL